MLGRLCLLLFLCGWFSQGAKGQCTAGSPCSLELGTPFPDIEPSSYEDVDVFFEITKNDPQYFAFDLTEEDCKETIHLSLTLLYGLADIHLTDDGSTPSLSNFKWSSHRSDIREIISMTPDELGGCAGGRAVSAAVAAGEPARGRLLLSKASAPAALKVGLPQLAVAPEATGRGTRLYSLATAELAPGAPLLVSVTQLGGALAGLTLTNGEHSWSAHPDADGESYLYFTSPSTSLGEPTSTIEVACANASAFVVLAAHGTAQHPTWLPGGLALVDYAPAGQTRHYVAELPAARGGDAAFAVALEPQHGAAPDLFLASRAAGFVEPEEADEVGDGEETWLAATGGNGFELVTAKSGDGVYVDGGGRYYVTAAAAAMDDEEEGEFDAGALYAAALTSAASLTALRESRPIYSTAAKGEYKYFQFYDANPTEENNLMILLSSISGDADLFVGCIVNNTGNDNGFPSKQSGHYNFSSQSFWDDSVTIHHADAKSCAKPGHPGTFYAAVRGYSAAEFTVTAVRGGGTITLRPGVPQLGTVFATMWQRYRVWVGEQRRAFSVVVTPEYGDPDVLVSADGKEATWLHFQAASLHSGQDPDSVTLTASQVCAECWVSMEVISVWGEARYAITATLGDGGVVLKDAWPQQATLGPAEYAFFSFTPAEDGDLVATLTVLHGHADLVLSTDIERPTFEEEDADGVYTATQDGHETPRITVQNVRAGQKWHLGVLGAGEGQTASVVTVQAHLERGGGAATLNHLLDGVPQDDLLAAGETHYFQLAAQPGHGVVKFIATPFEGRVDMWVRRCAAADGGGRCAAPGRLPSAGNHTWSAAAAPSGEAVTFDRLDAAPTSYLVALENPGQVAADVALTGYFEGSVLRLVPGKAVRDHVKEGQTAYYKVEARAFNSTLTVALTAFSGDPDLYASTSIAHPNAENFTWVMNTAGDDTLHIHPDQVECMAAVCTVFVGVYGWEEADYSIVAKFAGTDEVALRLGQPQTDAVAEGDYAYYRYRLAADYRLQPDLTLSLTMAYGDADLFATLDGTEPSYANCHYCSESTVGAEALTVRPSEALYQEHCGDGGDGVAGDGRGCMLRVSVYGYSAAEYTLLLRAAGREPALLQENVPFQATLAQGAYEYFEFVWQEPKMDLHVTSFSGHPTLYMSFENRWPNATVADYHLGPLHMGDAATVFIIAEPNDTLPMPVYFSVYGATATHFALMASQSGERGGDVARLYYGLQQAGGVAQGDFKYYRVRTAARQATVELLVSATEGNVDLYVGRLDQDLPELDEDGKVVNYVLKAVTPGAGEHIEVPFGGLGLCFRPDMGSCYFVLAVYGAQDSLYTVLATTAEQLDLLQDGVPQRGHAAQGRYAYYGFQLLDPEADLAVTVTPFSGDPDLYVGPGPPAPLPTKTNRTWASAWIGEEALTLQAAEMAELCTPSPGEGRACEYIFAVHGFTNTTFTITVATATGWENPTVLLLGQPQTGVVADQGFTYYQIHLVQDGDREPNVVVTLTSLDGGDQDLYITFDPAQEPGPDTAVVASNSWSGSDVVRLTPGMPDYCATCTMYIGVYGYIGGSFTLVVSTGLQQLQAGHPQHGSVAQGDYQYYALYNPGGGALALDLTALSGDADLFVATDLALPEGELPDYSLFGWASYAQGSDSVRILPTDEGYCTDCTFLVGVYGFTNASYTLAARLGEGAGGEVTRLTHHRPQSGAAAAGETQYFSVALGNAREDLVLALTALTGRADLYVKRAIADADGSVSLGGLPSADDYEYTTLGLAVERIVIPSGSGSGQEDFGTIASYVIALVAEQDTEYSLVATYGYHPQVLQANVPVRAAVAAGGTAYYEFLLDRNEDVHISCVAISGDPDIVVSTGPGLPSCIIPEGTQGTACTNFTWGSFDYSTDTLTISHTNPCVPTTENAIIYDCDPSQFHQGPFYIGVYSQNGAAFTLAAGAAGGVTSLVDGLPQHGVTAPDVLCEHLNTEGGCDDEEDDRQWAQVARFRFKVSKHDLNADGHIAITLTPDCKESGLESDTSGSRMGPGCSPKDPLELVVRSCRGAACTRGDQRPLPVPERFHARRSVDALHGTIFIANDPLDPDNGFCDPSRGDGETCYYYISVIHYNASVPAAFTIMASTPGDVAVIPCPEPLPADGVMASHLEAVARGGQKNYEACAREGKALAVSLELCSGDLELMLCDEDCTGVYPTPTSYYRKANKTHTCALVNNKTPNQNDKLTEECSVNDRGFPWVDIALATDSTFFIGVAGTGTYKLRLQAEVNDAEELPFLTTTNRDPQVTVVEGGAGAAAFDAAAVAWPPAAAVWRAADRPEPRGLFYTVYVLDLTPRAVEVCAAGTAPSGDRQQQPACLVSTPCGLQHHLTTYPEHTTTYQVEAYGSPGGEDRTFRVEGLEPETDYAVMVVARCGPDCVRELAGSRCFGKACQEIALTYAAARLTTGSNFEARGMWGLVKGVFGLVCLAAVAALGAFGFYKRRRARDRQPQYHLQNADDGMQLTLSSAPADFMRRRFRQEGGAAAGGLADVAAQPLMAGEDFSEDEADGV